jgi:two-component system cell cycle response regulator
VKLLSPGMKCELLSRMSGIIDRQDLLDLLGKEIEKLAAFDGYLFMLRDAKGENLITHKVHFGPDSYFFEKSILHHQITLAGNTQNANANAYLTRSTITVNHGNGTEDQKQLLSLWGFEELVAIPINIDDRNENQNPLGVLLLFKKKGNIDQHSLEQAKEMLSVFYRSMNNSLAYSFLEEQRERFNAAEAENARFLKFIVEINNLTSSDKIFELFGSELFRQIGFDGLSFFLAEQDTFICKKVLVSHSRYQPTADKLEQFFRDTPYLVKKTEGGISQVYANNTHLALPDVQKIIHLPMTEKDRTTVSLMKSPRTLLIIPIRYQNKPIGATIFFSLEEVVPISDSDLHLLSDLSSFLGTAITNSNNYELSQVQNREIARLNLILEDKVKELAEQAATDRLTGLYNFRVFEQELGRRLSEYQRTTDKSGLSIAIIDIDHFKKFNDTYGHSAGNDVLSGVAKEITKLVRKMDLACRYGGEEFVVIMTKCELEGIKIFAERMRLAIQNAVFRTVAGELAVTVSIGCASFKADDTYESLFNRADQALYRAKHNGRNQVKAA